MPKSKQLTLKDKWEKDSKLIKIIRAAKKKIGVKK